MLNDSMTHCDLSPTLPGQAVAKIERYLPALPDYFSVYEFSKANKLFSLHFSKWCASAIM